MDLTTRQSVFGGYNVLVTLHTDPCGKVSFENSKSHACAYCLEYSVSHQMNSSASILRICFYGVCNVMFGLHLDKFNCFSTNEQHYMKWIGIG